MESKVLLDGTAFLEKILNEVESNSRGLESVRSDILDRQVLQPSFIPNSFPAWLYVQGLKGNFILDRLSDDTHSL